jgi:hypothetical protein
MWREAEQKFLAVLKGKTTGVLGPEVSRLAKLSKHITYKVAKRLLDAGKVRHAVEGGRQGYLLA